MSNIQPDLRYSTICYCEIKVICQEHFLDFGGTPEASGEPDLNYLKKVLCQNIQPALKYSTLFVWNEGHLSVTLLWLWSRFPTPWMEIRKSRWVRSRAKTLKIIEGFLSKYSAISVTFNSLSIWNKGDLSGTFNWLLEGIPDSMNEDHELKIRWVWSQAQDLETHLKKVSYQNI